ncbi:hypothetical protein AB0H71_04580 [Nocardia sp. NPDC050697]|uniref:hypothetical protein n=1 Tax=Nocardia sp. NPDC050697 TaxID=3155158 RepID=UPI003406AF12
MTGLRHRAAPSRRFESGTACLVVLIVATLGTGVAVLSTSLVATVLVVLAITAVLGIVVVVL